MAIVKLNAKAAAAAAEKMSAVRQPAVVSELGKLIDQLQVATNGNADFFSDSIVLPAGTKSTKHIVAQLGRKGMKGMIDIAVENEDGTIAVSFTATALSDDEKAQRLAVKEAKALVKAAK